MRAADLRLRGEAGQWSGDGRWAQRYMAADRDSAERLGSAGDDALRRPRDAGREAVLDLVLRRSSSNAV